jgi:PAS domain S-box-containing protein
MTDISTTGESYYRWLIEHSSDIISVFRIEGSILFKSPIVERLLGYAPAELIGENEFDYIHPDDHARVHAALDEVSAHREVGSTISYRVRHKDGSWLYLESIGMMATDSHGELVCIVNSRDITGRKRAEMESEAFVRKLREEQPPD